MGRGEEETGPVGQPSSGCGCVPKRVTARASSSESLEGARASIKKGPAASGQRLWYNVLHRLRGGGGASNLKGGGGGGAAGLGTWSGVLIPTCENMWGKLMRPPLIFLPCLIMLD